MRNLKEKILLNAEKEYLDQYDYPYGDGIENLRDKYAKSIGHFMITFSYLENAIDSLIASSINQCADEPRYS